MLDYVLRELPHHILKSDVLLQSEIKVLLQKWLPDLDTAKIKSLCSLKSPNALRRTKSLTVIMNLPLMRILQL